MRSGDLWGNDHAQDYWSALRDGTVPEAEQRAMKLLQRVCDPYRFSLYCHTGQLPAMGNVTKATYLVRLTGGVLELRDGQPDADWCISVGPHAHDLPPTDHVIALKCLIEGEELAFMRTGNRMWMGRDRWMRDRSQVGVREIHSEPFLPEPSQKAANYLDEEALNRAVLDVRQTRLGERRRAPDNEIIAEEPAEAEWMRDEVNAPYIQYRPFRGGGVADPDREAVERELRNLEAAVARSIRDNDVLLYRDQQQPDALAELGDSIMGENPPPYMAHRRRAFEGQLGAGAFLTEADMNTANDYTGTSANVQFPTLFPAGYPQPDPNGLIAQAGRDIALRTLHLDGAGFHEAVDEEVNRMDAEQRPAWESAHLQSAAVDWRSHYIIGEPIEVPPPRAAGLTMPEFRRRYGHRAVARRVGPELYDVVA